MLDFLEALENYECALELLKNHGDEIMNISVFIMIIVLLVAIIITKKKKLAGFYFRYVFDNCYGCISILLVLPDLISYSCNFRSSSFKHHSWFYIKEDAISNY